MAKNKHFTLKITIAIILFFLLANSALAALNLQNSTDFIGQTATGTGLSQTRDFSGFMAMIIQIVLGLIGIIFFILILYGGFSWMTAATNSEKIEKAKKLITNAVIGLIIVTSAYSISYFIARALEAGQK